MSDTPSTPPQPPPRPSRWKQRLGLAGAASLGGLVAWLFGRREKTPDS